MATINSILGYLESILDKNVDDSEISVSTQEVTQDDIKMIDENAMDLEKEFLKKTVPDLLKECGNLRAEASGLKIMNCSLKEKLAKQIREQEKQNLFLQAVFSIVGDFFLSEKSMEIVEANERILVKFYLVALKLLRSVERKLHLIPTFLEDDKISFHLIKQILAIMRQMCTNENIFNTFQRYNNFEQLPLAVVKILRIVVLKAEEKNVFIQFLIDLSKDSPIALQHFDTVSEIVLLFDYPDLDKDSLLNLVTNLVKNLPRSQFQIVYSKVAEVKSRKYSFSDLEALAAFENKSSVFKLSHDLQ